MYRETVTYNDNMNYGKMYRSPEEVELQQNIHSIETKLGIPSIEAEEQAVRSQIRNLTR